MSLTHGRHPSNLMLDRLSGKIVHIDFGDCFEVAMTREKFPEKIPFRLTRMLIHAMEVHWFAKKGTSGLCWPNLFNLLVNRYNTYFIRYMWPTTTKWVLTCKLDASKLQFFFFNVEVLTFHLIPDCHFSPKIVGLKCAGTVAAILRKASSKFFKSPKAFPYFLLKLY